jgi:diacylglycerol kinase (ATP)
VQQRIGWIKGVARYLVAALLGILDRPAWQVQMEWDGGSYEGPVSLITVGNGPRSGGFFYMSPNADCFDGKLTVVFGYRSTRRSMLALLPKTFTRGKGSYVGQPGIREIHVSWLEVRFANPSPAHVDGEIISDGIKQLSYRVHARKVPVLLPG